MTHHGSLTVLLRFSRQVLRDGILRVGRSAATKLANDPVDDWFNNIGDSSIANLLRLYAKVCRYFLAPQLSTLAMDRSLLDPPARTCAASGAATVAGVGQQAAPSPMAPPHTGVHPADYQSSMGPPMGAAPAAGAGHNHMTATAQGQDGKPTSPKIEPGQSDCISQV